MVFWKLVSLTIFQSSCFVVHNAWFHAWETHLFEAKLWVFLFTSSFVTNVEFHTEWGSVICHIEKLNLTAGRDTAATSFKQHYRLQLFAFWYFMIPNLELFLQRGCRPSVGSGLIRLKLPTLGSLSKGVFERRTSTGSEVFSLLTCLDDIKFVFLSFFTVIEAIWLKICAKPPSKNQKRPLPVDVRRSKTLFLKLPIVWHVWPGCGLVHGCHLLLFSFDFLVNFYF